MDVKEPSDRREKRSKYLRLSFFPWYAAAFLFTPRYRLGEPLPEIVTTHRVRTVLAYVIAGVTTLPYIGRPRIGELGYAFLDDAYLDTLYGGVAVMPVMLVSGAVLVVLSPSRWRRAVAFELLRPLTTAAIFSVFLAGLTLCTSVLWDPAMASSFAGPFAIAMLWLLFFLPFAMYFVVRHLCNAVDGHPLLPPVTITLFAWWLVVQRLILPSEYLPPHVDLLLGVGGALVVTAVSAVEVFRLYRKGITLDTGPYPPTSAPPHVPPPRTPPAAT